MKEATAPRNTVISAVSHTDHLNLFIQKRINSIARSIEHRFKEKIKSLQMENDVLRSHLNMFKNIEQNTVKSEQNIIKQEHITVKPEQNTFKSEQNTVKPEQNTVKSAQNTLKLEQITVNSEQETVNSEKETVNSEQITVNSEQITVNSEQITVNSEQTSVNSEQTTVNSKQTTVNSEQTTVNSEQTTVNSKQTTVHSEQNTVNSIQNGEEHSQNSVENNTEGQSSVPTIMQLPPLYDNVIETLKIMDPDLIGYTLLCEPVLNTDSFGSILNEIQEEYDSKIDSHDKSYVRKGELGSMVRSQKGHLHRQDFNKIISYLQKFSMCYYALNIKQNGRYPDPYTLENTQVEVER
jgi:hypothetical protein